MKWLIGRVHKTVVFERRVRVLADKLQRLIPPGAHVLDVGTGDGQLAKMIGEKSKSSVEGLEVLIRPRTHIQVTLFDGTKIPKKAKSFDLVSFVDVLHHVEDPVALLAEAARVARKAVVIKDHLCETALDRTTLRMMDLIGNAPHGVALPYNYASYSTWMKWFDEAGLEVDILDTDVPLYAFPLSAVFGRNLHFVASLRPSR